MICSLLIDAICCNAMKWINSDVARVGSGIVRGAGERCVLWVGSKEVGQLVLIIVVFYWWEE